jgi:hypothetical protein
MAEPSIPAIPPRLQPTLSASSPPSCYLIVLDLREDEHLFHKRCLEAGFLMRNLGNNVLLLMSYDSPEYWNEGLHILGQPAYEIASIQLGPYRLLH